MKFDRKKHSPVRNALMERVAEAIAERKLTHVAAANAIGVNANTLQKHLLGEHVRSDSARKYEDWITGRDRKTKVFAFPRAESATEKPAENPIEEALPFAPAAPHLIVDIFSGCGGLSLGFDLLGGGRYFRTVLALDNQQAPIAVLNKNAGAFGRTNAPVGRQMDLTEFMNETEFLSFYIEHSAELHSDTKTARLLKTLCNGAFAEFRNRIAAVDAEYLADLTRARASENWRNAFERMDKQALSQTSVIAFHDRLRLPKSGLKPPKMPLVLWGDRQNVNVGKLSKPSIEALREARISWAEEVAGLELKRQATGRGQLTASARRVTAFVDFLASDAFSEIRRVWATWRARRIELRAALFTEPYFAAQVQELYAATYPVSVLVGGPPCQGFSRIGRGKIRSLREAMVHVHGNAEAGDARNLLFQQYVMVLGALRPKVFLFENVQHFQSTVRADGVEFQATAVLAEAIANMSEGRAAYGVSSRTVDASRHGVPQTRQRFFMCGVLEEPHSPAADAKSAEKAAADCLALPRYSEVPLSAALAGLPEPRFVGGDTVNEGIDVQIKIDGSWQATGAIGHFTSWVRQPAPGSRTASTSVDAHVARAARSDDADFFALMGPGKRWMDYRADDSPTMIWLQNLLKALVELPASALTATQRSAKKAGQRIPDHTELEEVLSKLNGALPIRLLLEQTSEKLGAPHHLLTESYLAKRDGNHGDWVARMDPVRAAKTMVSHMGKDTYGFIHPSLPRTISVREAARVQAFPDWFSFGGVALTDAFKIVGNAVPPLLSHAIAARVAQILVRSDTVSAFAENNSAAQA